MKCLGLDGVLALYRKCIGCDESACFIPEVFMGWWRCLLYTGSVYGLVEVLALYRKCLGVEGVLALCRKCCR
jgi:hypothetical protein